MNRFEDIVRAMTAKQIIMAMVEGLHNPIIRLNMNTFGSVFLVDNTVCVGCAATNIICRISGVTFNPDNIKSRHERSKAVNSEREFLKHFEYAIDALRQGEIYYYNKSARIMGISVIKDIDLKLPVLDSNFEESELDVYVQLANLQS